MWWRRPRRFGPNKIDRGWCVTRCARWTLGGIPTANTQLKIVLVEADAERAALHAYDGHGFVGQSRVGDAGRLVPDYFANLIMSERAVRG